MRELFKCLQEGDYNKDLAEGKSLEYYLRMTEGFVSSFKPFDAFELNGRHVIDESTACPVGYKARAGELLVSELSAAGVNEIVYVQPRQGFAGISLAYLCSKYNMDLTLIMPSSKEASAHQRLCIELGAKPLFMRVAAMPNANAMAKRYAEKTGAYYIPLGLNHEMVVACGVRQVYDFFKDIKKPKRMWTAMSTGVLSRTLQIALPETEFVAVAVSRNIQHGELGRAKFMSYHKPFGAESDLVPLEFESESRYDAKAYDYFSKMSDEGDWFFNVAGNAPAPRLSAKDVDSYRDWNDLRDFKLYIN